MKPRVTRADCDRTGCSRQGIHQRIAHGWTHEEAITFARGAVPARFAADPYRTHTPLVTAARAAACAAAGITYGAYKSRRRMGLSHEDALVRPANPRGRPRKGTVVHRKPEKKT